MNEPKLPPTDRYLRWLNEAAQTFCDPAYVRDELMKTIDRLRAEEDKGQPRLMDFGA